MKMKSLFFWGWALVAASLAFQPSGWVVSVAMMCAFVGGHLLGYRNGKLDAAEDLRESMRKWSALK